MNISGFEEVLVDENTRVYENNEALPKAFFVNRFYSASGKNEAIKNNV